MNNLLVNIQIKKWLQNLRINLSIWILVICIITNFVALIPSIELLSNEGRDFSQDYIAAIRLLNNTNIYSPFSKAEMDNLGINITTTTYQNYHPPTTILFVLPLTFFSFKAAVYIWSFISILFFLCGVYIICRELNYHRLFLLSFLSFVWFPFWLNIRFGQFSTIIFFLLVLVWVGIRKGKNITNGLLISLAVLVKIFPAFILFWAFLNRKWKTIIVSALSCLPIIFIIFIWRPESILDYVDVAQKNTLNFRAYYGNFSLNGLIGRIFIGYDQIQPFFYSEKAYSFLVDFFTIALILLTLIYFLKVRNVEKQFSVAIITMLLLSPTTWAHCWTILLLPGFILLKNTSQYKTNFYKYGLLLFFILTFFPHWQFLTYLETKIALPLPNWVSLTAIDMYASLVLYALFLIEIKYRPQTIMVK